MPILDDVTAQLLHDHPLPELAARAVKQHGFARGIDAVCFDGKPGKRAAAVLPWLVAALFKKRDMYTATHLWDKLPEDAQVVAIKVFCDFLSIPELLSTLHNHPNVRVRCWAAMQLAYFDDRRGLMVDMRAIADSGIVLTGAPSVRTQVFEVVVRQAIAGAPWRMICAGPMQVNDIAEDEVVHEMFKRELRTFIAQSEIRMGIPPTYTMEISEYAAMWRAIAATCKEMFVWRADAAMDDLWQAPSYPECTRLFGNATIRTSIERSQASSTREIFSRWISNLHRADTDREAAEEVLLRWYDEWGAPRPANVVWIPSPKAVSEVIRREGLTLQNYVGPCIGALRRGALSTAIDIQRSAAIGEVVLRSITGDRTTLFQELPDLAWSTWNVASRGQLDVPMLVALERTHAVADFAYCSVILEAAKVCGFWWTFKDHLIITPKPQRMEIDDRFRPHSLTGPAVQFDDWEQYFVHGVAVPPWVVQEPETITTAKIDETTNAELRRVLIELYGVERYVMDSGATIRHTSPRGVLLAKGLLGDEPIVMVKVINSTAEPDGTYKEYFLRVPPDMMTVEDVIAWTFAMRPEDYSPARET